MSDSNSISSSSSTPTRLYGDTMYDAFYAKIYSRLFTPFPGSGAVIQSCTPKIHSCCLVVGEGGASFAEELASYFLGKVPSLQNMTFVFCADPRNIETATSPTNPNVSILAKSPLDATCFPVQSFTHILCPGLALYRYDAADRRRMMHNLYRWIKPGGTLVLQTANAEAIQAHLSRQGSSDSPKAEYSVDAHIHQGKNTFLVVNESFSGNSLEGSRSHEYILFHHSTADIVSSALNEGFVTKHATTVAPDVQATIMVAE